MTRADIKPISINGLHDVYDVLTENFALAMAPALMAFVGQLLLGDAAAQSRIAAIRASHREMLLILLDKERGCRP